MAISRVDITVSDGNLGIVTGAGSENFVYFDCSTKAVPGQFRVFNNLSSISSILGLGSLAERVAYSLSLGGGPVSAVGLEPSLPGSVGSVTHSGTGTGTVDAYTGPDTAVKITITTTGANGTGKFVYQVGSDGYSAAQTIPGVADGYSFRVPGTYANAVFSQQTYTANQAATLNTDGTSSGTLSAAIASDSSPIDDYSVVITITRSGAAGTGKFTYSLDNGVNNSPPLTIPATYVVPHAGLVLDFGGTFVAGDTYNFLTCGPTFTSSDLLTAVNALNLTTPFSIIVVNNKSVTAAAAFTFSAVVDTACSNLFDSAMFVRGLLNTPSEGDLGGASGSVATSGGNLVQSTDDVTDIENAFDAAVSTRMGCGAYDALITSPLNGRTLRRNWSWAVSARLGQVSPSERGSQPVLGGVQGVTAISGNEFLDEALSDAGFSTPRTWQGRPGLYPNSIITFSSKIASDFSDFTNCRVMDLACNIVRKVAIPLIDTKIATNANGTILGVQADLIDAKFDNALLAQLVAVNPQEAVKARAQVNRFNNVLSTGELQVTVVVQPFGYATEIAITIGFGGVV